LFEWVGVSEAGKGWRRLAFGLNGSGSMSPAWCQQGILHDLCAQTMLKALVTSILRKCFVCVKMLILYWGLNFIQILPTLTNDKQGLELPESVPA